MSEGKRIRVYLCDPSKNTECSKTSCQWQCRMTAQKEYSTDGKALTEEEANRIQEEAEKFGDKVELDFRDFQDLCPFFGLHYKGDSHCEVEGHCKRQDRQTPGESWADCNASVCPYTRRNKPRNPEEEK